MADRQRLVLEGEVTSKATPSALAWVQRLPSSGAFGAAVAALVTLIVFSIVAPNFLSPTAIVAILAIAAEIGIVALGVTLLMTAGEFDLSVGSVLGLSALTVPLLMNAGLPALVA